MNSEKGRDTCNNRNKEHYVARKVYLWLSAKAQCVGMPWCVGMVTVLN